MKHYQMLVVKEKSRFKQFTMQQVLWGQNEKANKLAKLASSTVESLDPGILMKYLPRPSTEAEKDKEVNTDSPKPKWASQIMKYLKNGELPENKGEARKLKVKVS